MATLSVTEAAERLRRVLAVERQGGCQDRAVMGGLDKLLSNLLAQQPQGKTPLLGVVQTLGRHRYAELSTDERRAWIERALRLLTAPSPPAARGAERIPKAGRSTPSMGRAAPAPHGQRQRTGTASPAADPVTDAAPPGSAARPALAASTVPSQPRGASAPPATPNGTAKLGSAVARVNGKRATSPAAESSPTLRTRSKPPAGAPTLDSPVTALPGIGANRAELLAKLDILTVRDLIEHYPHRHEDFSRVAPVAELQVGETQTLVARVWSASLVSFGPSPRKSTELIVGDETGNLRVIFFNNPYPAASLRTNQRLTLSGKVTAFHGQKQLENPEWEIVEQGGDLDQAIHTGRLVPVYPLTQGIQNRALRGYVRKALDLCADQLADPLPAELRRRYGYQALPQAIRQAHYPDNAEALETARRRLAYDELLALQLAVVARKARRAASVQTAPLLFPETLRQQFFAGLPFPLTGAQTRAAERILADLARETPMARLLQGDVGSGKTVVAATALLAAAVNQRQAVLMAPTEILAEQHFRTLCRLFGTDAAAVDGEALAEAQPTWLDRPLRLGLLRGGLRARAKRDVQAAIAAGEIEIAIGTQALIQQGVEFARLGLTVIDEQHRFGVMQRSTLAGKGENTHLLVMTATPIPRTLALSLYGDLDVSVIDELPPGRKPVKTRVLEPHQREFAYRFVRDQVGQGFQAFVICPLVEESETLEVRAATEEYERLRTEIFPDLRVSLLHGRMTPAEKDAVMAGFRDREADVLVSTAVVEVGIDIPAATVIMIEGAERFGLAQLHQFRGRVGRSGDQAYCLLLTDSPAQEARTRLKLLEQTRDGFALAEEDLKLRGPGDYFGTRQSGLPALRQARLTDTPILEAAREDALALVARDPLLATPELAALGARVAALAERAGDAN